MNPEEVHEPCEACAGTCAEDDVGLEAPRLAAMSSAGAAGNLRKRARAGPQGSTAGRLSPAHERRARVVPGTALCKALRGAGGAPARPTRETAVAPRMQTIERAESYRSCDT
jgi:hypothetical protein